MLRGFGARDHEATVLETERLAPHFVRIRNGVPNTVRGRGGRTDVVVAVLVPRPRRHRRGTLALMAGLHEPVRGRVLFDGVDLATLDPAARRAAVSVVFQHPYLFEGSPRRQRARW